MSEPTNTRDEILTPEQRNFVRAFKRLARKMPDGIRIYVLDSDNVTIALEGVSLEVYQEDVRFKIHPGCILDDLHQDFAMNVDGDDKKEWLTN